MRRWILSLILTICAAGVPVARAETPDRCIYVKKQGITGILNVGSGAYAEYQPLPVILAVSPDGRFKLEQADSRGNPSLTIVDTRSGTRRTINTIWTQDIRGLIWSPDNKYVAFGNYSTLDSTVPIRGSLYIVGIQDMSVADLTLRETKYWYVQGWSSDGRYLLYVEGQPDEKQVQYKVYDVKQQKVATLPVISSQPQFVWSPQGADLAMGLGKTRLDIFSMRDGVPEQSTFKFPDFAWYRQMWSPDNNYVALYGFSEEGALLIRRDGKVMFKAPGMAYQMSDYFQDWVGDGTTWLASEPGVRAPQDADLWEQRTLIAYHPETQRSEVLEPRLLIPRFRKIQPTYGYNGIPTYTQGQRMFMVYQTDAGMNVDISDLEGKKRRTVVTGAAALPIAATFQGISPSTAEYYSLISKPNPFWSGETLITLWQSADGKAHLTWADGTTQHTINDGDVEITDVHVVGAYMLYLARADSKAAFDVVLADIKSGETRRLLTAVTRPNQWYVSPSPDGKYMILHINATDPAQPVQYVLTSGETQVRAIGPGPRYLAGPNWEGAGSPLVAFLIGDETDTSKVAVEIDNAADGSRKTYPAGKSSFIFPRVFDSRPWYLEWGKCE